MNIANPEYKRAFEAYLRRGAPIGLSLKQERTTTHYVWRTRGDGKVRPSHAVNNGKIFAWDDPPPTGHPGEDYGCRCTAEPYAPGIREHMTMIMSGISDAGRVWKDEWDGDFIDHYRHGNGRAIRLRDTGHLQNVVNEYWRQVEERLLGQIADAARESVGSPFLYDFNNTYYMGDIVWDLGEVTISGVAKGHSHLDKMGALNISGQCDFYFYDHYRDVLDLWNILPGDNFDWFLAQTYEITDAWQGKFSGVVQRNRDGSKYRK